MAAIVANEMCGSSQCRNGTRKREVCSADNASVEPAKISIIQAITGTHLKTTLRIDMFNRGEHCRGRRVACERRLPPARLPPQTLANQISVLVRVPGAGLPRRWLFLPIFVARLPPET